MQFLLADSLIRRITAVPPLYLLLWLVLVVLSIVLIVLMRSRWGKSRPVHKCAVLSLLVHVLLACLAMTVRMVVGDDGSASGPPIRVTLIDEVTMPIAAPPQPPPLFDAPEPEVEAEETEPAAAVEEIAEVDVAPALLEPESTIVDSDPSPQAEVAAIEQAPDIDPFEQVAESSSSELKTEASLPPPDPITDVTVPMTDQQLASTPVPQPTVPVMADTAAEPYALRMRPDRLMVVQEQGGNRQTEAAVAAALRWLASAQSGDGRWDANRFGAGQERAVLGHNRHGAGAKADTGITSLALLAFLAAGHTHLDGPYHDVVEKGLRYLIRNQAADGNLAGEASIYARMYCHSMSTFALAEAHAMTHDRWLAPAAERAIRYSVLAQHPSTGGWRYRLGDTGDTSQLGWQMMSLWSAEQGDIDVAPQTWTGIERFLRSVRRGRFGGLASYRSDGRASNTMTAEAFYCWQLLTEAVGGTVDHASAEEATYQLLDDLPSRERMNLYYWYYATLALHHHQSAGDSSAAAWQTWNNALTDVLLTSQEDIGSNAGSWSPATVWGGYGGRVYSTALATLCLEVYYRYAPSSPAEDPWIAVRPGERAPR